MEQPDHDIESQRADASPSEDEHDEVPPLSDEGGPGRGSLATEAAAGTVGDVVAGSLVGWGSAGIAATGTAVALPLAGAVVAGGLIEVGGVTVARRLGMPVDQAAHGAGRAAAARAVGPAATTAARASKSAAAGYRDRALEPRLIHNGCVRRSTEGRSATSGPSPP